MICNELGINENDLLSKTDILIKKFLTNDVNIQTIDSFINKILRKFSFFAGFRSNFDVGDIDREIIFKEFLKDLKTDEFKLLIDIAKKEEKFSSLLNLFEDLYEKDKELQGVKSENGEWIIDEVLKQIEELKN